MKTDYKTDPELTFPCAHCGTNEYHPGVMQLRINHVNDSVFYGCSNYPACKATEALIDEEVIDDYLTKNYGVSLYELDLL